MNQMRKMILTLQLTAFDVTELKKGDIIYRDMWKDPEWSYFTKMGNVEIADVGRDDYDFVILADSKDRRELGRI
jgi:hypothetical protein